MSFEFFRFSTLSTNHTLSYMANPLHFASASNPRITHNEKCSVLRPAELRLAFWTPKCLAAQPRNFPETNGQIAHIRAHISPTIHATAHKRYFCRLVFLWATCLVCSMSDSNVARVFIRPGLRKFDGCPVTLVRVKNKPTVGL